MPNLKIQRQVFDELMGTKYEFKKLEDFGFEFGIEIEEDSDQVGNETKHYYKFDCMNNRPDLLTEMSLTRIFKIYMGQIDTPEIKLTHPTTQIVVDPSVKQIRPFIVGAVLRNFNFNEFSYKSFINAQEKLHATFCRARKYASIGTHDLDKIKGPFRYVAKDPKDFKFIPLRQTQEVDGHGMMALLENDKLKQYLPLIRDSPVYPLVLDSEDNVCSVPPIINSERSKISMETKNVFIEVTALSRPKAMICLATMIWSFSEFCSPSFEVEPVEIIDGESKFITPTIEQSEFTISHKKAENMIGASLTAEQIVGYLKRTGMKATPKEDGTYKVLVPFWRVDVLHECDILEDIAICYGYPKITPTLPPSSTIGGQLRINKFSDFLRQEMAQAQFNEALNFTLCCKADLTTNIFNKDDSLLITIDDAKTKQFQTGRTTLLPGLLRTIVENKSMPLPYKLFEVGDCIVLDKSSDTGARNIRKIAAVYTDQVTDTRKKGLFSTIHGSLDNLLKKCNLEFPKNYSLRKSAIELYFPGQQFEIVLEGRVVGTLGVVHPNVLQNFGWNHPTVMWELDIVPLEKAYTNSYK